MAQMGRPKKVIDYDMVLDLASIFCTQEEIATILGVSRKTLNNDKLFTQTYKKGIENAKSSLRRTQFKLAQKGNVTMAIWLGKQYLGQREPKQEFDIDTNKEVIQEIGKLADKL